MSLNRVFRYLGGLLIATVLLFLILPFAGIATAKFIPPPLAYAKADGVASGVITAKTVSPTANPFRVGDHVWLIDYKFQAPAPPPRGETKPGPKQGYTGQVRVGETLYGEAHAGAYIPKIKYVKSDPDINGIDNPAAAEFNSGRSVGAGSNIISGWLLFLALDLAFGYLLMLPLERFGRQENI